MLIKHILENAEKYIGKYLQFHHNVVALKYYWWCTCLLMWAHMPMYRFKGFFYKKYVMTHTNIKWIPAKYFIYLIKEGTDKIWQLICRRSQSVPHSLSDKVWWNRIFSNGKLITVYRAESFNGQSMHFLLGSVFRQ